MRIIHTADWHLGHRLGRIDRAGHIRAAVQRVVDACLRERADVLLICGDLFHDVGRAEVLRESVQFLGAALAPFFAAGGTVLAVTGNHDREHQASILQQAMKLAAPAETRPGDELRPGRFYLFTGPTFFRMADASSPGTRVQFVMMPWPTATRYLDDPDERFASVEARHRALRAAFTRRIGRVLGHAAFDNGLHTVLAAHVITRGAEVRDGFGLNESDALVFDDAELPTGLAYVALGDVHRPQRLMGLSHVRYAGSVERLGLGDSGDEKGVVLVEVGSAGRTAEPRWIPLESTPIYRVRIDDPAAQLPGLVERYPDHATALVNLDIRYRPGRDNLNEVLAELERVFPNWYVRDWPVAGGDATEGNGGASSPAAGDAAAATGTGTSADVGDTVRRYLAAQWSEHPDRDELLGVAESLLAEAAAAGGEEGGAS
jgi:exonuclease SbcD